MVREPRPDQPQQQESSSSSKDSSLPTSLIRILYIGHFLARWDARLYRNSLGIFILYPAVARYSSLSCVLVCGCV